MMAIRTTTTRTTSSACGPSADSTVAPYPFSDLVQAYYDCRRSKRNSTSALAFEARLGRTAAVPAEDLRETANSYFGLLTQASHSHKDRAALARLVIKRGHAVNGDLTKTYQKRPSCPTITPRQAAAALA